MSHRREILLINPLQYSINNIQMLLGDFVYHLLTNVHALLTSANLNLCENHYKPHSAEGTHKKLFAELAGGAAPNLKPSKNGSQCASTMIN
jgi:hypothetical protein